MQQATHQRLHLRDAHDAHVLFEAVRQGFLTPVARRLNEMERRVLVHSGAIFVWVESEDDNGLRRWTDGRIWGQSRMREPYLFYDEKMPYNTAQAANEATRGPAFRFVDGIARDGPTSAALSHQDRTTCHHTGLVKQAYSAYISPNPHSRPQKWHLTAYFTYADLHDLPTIDQDPVLKTMIVPAGIYRTGKPRSKSDDDEETSPHGGRVSDSELPWLPPLSSLQAIGEYLAGPMISRPQCQRLPEDQRMIEMLNSRHLR